MCGISGIVSFNGNPKIRDQIDNMNNVIKHRGPDGDGVYINDSQTLALGHRRLSIIDLSTNASQPFFYDNRYVIVYNGEIYNYKELKRELLNKGCHFTTESDTEVILAAYSIWKNESFGKFNGMWALCIYDIKKNTIILSRDRFGIKPLYIYKTIDTVLFSSEIKQIIEVTGALKLNESVFSDFLFFDFINHNDQSFYDGIHKIDPGSYVEINLNNCFISKTIYFKLQPDTSVLNLSESDAAEKYLELLNDSVKLRLRSDVQVGTCLSGGLDSSYITALASMNYTASTNLISITAQSSEKKNDETHFAKIVADSFNIKHIIVKPSLDDYKEALPLIVSNQDEPFGGPSIVMQYFVMKAAQAAGCKVMLDGQGGDETLLGYERYFFLINQKKPFLSRIKDYHFISKNSKLSFVDTLKYAYYFGNKRLRHTVLKSRYSFIEDSFLESLDFRLFDELDYSNKSVIQTQIIDIEKRLLPLLHYEDKNSMLHSVEARLPFLDYRLVKTALALPDNLKIKSGWTKYVLRKGAESILPISIAWRKNKFGFEAPSNTWMENRQEIVDTILKDDYLSKWIKKLPPNINQSTLWRLYSFSLWKKQAKVYT